MNKNLNIVLFGENIFTNIVLESLIHSGHHVSLVIAPIYKQLRDEKLEATCKVNGIEFARYLNINSEEVVNKVLDTHPDLCVVSNMLKIIKEPLLSIPKMGFINVHPSLLPYYRGATPEHWPIINGEKKTGITVHYIDEGTDTGDIIIQKTIPIGENMYVGELLNEWGKVLKTIVVEAIECIVENKGTIKQSKEEGSYYGKIKDENRTIVIEEGVQKAYNLIRAFSFPFDGAIYKDVQIFRANIVAKEAQSEQIGSFYYDENDRLLLVFPDGALEITMSTLE